MAAMCRALMGLRTEPMTAIGTSWCRAAGNGSTQAEGMGDFKLQAQDKVLVYFAGANTKVVNSVAVSPPQPKPGETFKVTVTGVEWVWNNTTFASEPVVSPAAGVKVTIGGKTVTTDSQGVAVLKEACPAKYTRWP